MLRKNKKGFTIVELVIVIGVIGILSAVLIPTFINLNEKSKDAADRATLKNMASLIEVEKAEKGVSKLTLEESYRALKEGGFDLKTISPAVSNRLYGFNAETSEIGLYNSNKELIYSIGKDEGTVVNNVASIDGEELNLYLKSNYSFNQDLRMNLNVYSSESVDVTVDGTIIGNLTIDAPNANITQRGIVDGDGYGTIETVFDKGNLVINNANRVVLDGYVDQINSSNATSIETTANGVVRTIKDVVALSLTNNGWVNYVTDTSKVTCTNNGYYNGTKAATYEYQTDYVISKAEDLLKLSAKTQRSDLPYFSTNTSTGTASTSISLELESDIDITKMTYIPMATYRNKEGGSGPSKQLSIDINGRGHSIKGLRQNFLGAIGAGSSVNDLSLVFDYESDDNCESTENICYKNASYNGNITPYYLKATGEYYMHLGCLANAIINMTTTPIEINNLNVDGKMVFKNVENDVWYCAAVVAGEYNGANNNVDFVIRNLSLSESFKLGVIRKDGTIKYGDGVYQAPGLYAGDFGSTSTKIKVIYDDTVETGAAAGQSSVYPGWGTIMVPGGKIVTE